MFPLVHIDCNTTVIKSTPEAHQMYLDFSLDGKSGAIFTKGVNRNIIKQKLQSHTKTPTVPTVKPNWPLLEGFEEVSVLHLTVSVKTRRGRHG